MEGITSGSALHRTLLQDLPELDDAAAREQVLAAGRWLLARKPGLQAPALERINLSPYAQALQQATRPPLHDVIALLHGGMATLVGG